MSGELVEMATLPINYEKATKAIAECSRIDECQDWANKAAAMSSYAKQANDETLHRHADRIKARAIQRLGELSSAIEKRQGKRNGAGLIRGAPNKLEVLKANGSQSGQSARTRAQYSGG